ncbi:MAG: tyrosine-protein phosphatase [Dehalococcoidia bacterium]|nr:tyrosine-protein phosphatase [Dehalococcoidia bacterium]
MGRRTAPAAPQARANRIRDLLTGAISWTDSYIRIVNESRHTYHDFFHVLAEDDVLAVVFHCAGGRDRTGVAAGLLLSALGASDEAVAADYARTGEVLRPHAHRFTRIAGEIGFTPEQMSRLVAATEPESMLGLLRFLREEFGSTRGYLEAIGVPSRVVDDISERLVEPRYSDAAGGRRS